MKVQKTNRGFDNIEFTDRYEAECSLQKSSLATEDCIWFGVTDPEPQIMAIHAEKYGLKTETKKGWVNFPIPEEVLINTKMHLTREQVSELLPFLIKFVKTGELK